MKTWGKCTGANGGDYEREVGWRSLISRRARNPRKSLGSFSRMTAPDCAILSLPHAHRCVVTRVNILRITAASLLRTSQTWNLPRSYGSESCLGVVSMPVSILCRRLRRPRRPTIGHFLAFVEADAGIDWRAPRSSDDRPQEPLRRFDRRLGVSLRCHDHR